MAASLQELIAARRAQRERERTFVVPVRGYEDLGLKARYRPLGYEELRDVDDRNQDAEGAEGELSRYADSLLEANVDLLQDDQSLGCRWSSGPAALRDKLGIDVADGSTSRQCLFAVFNGPGGGNDLFLHWTLWDREASRVVEQIDEEQVGESPPSEEGSSKLSPTPSPAESE